MIFVNWDQFVTYPLIRHIIEDEVSIPGELVDSSLSYNFQML